MCLIFITLRASCSSAARFAHELFCLLFQRSIRAYAVITGSLRFYWYEFCFMNARSAGDFYFAVARGARYAMEWNKKPSLIFDAPGDDARSVMTLSIFGAFQLLPNTLFYIFFLRAYQDWRNLHDYAWLSVCVCVRTYVSGSNYKIQWSLDVINQNLLCINVLKIETVEWKNNGCMKR